MSNRQPTGPVLVIRHTGQVFPLTEAPVSIGRQPDNAIVLADKQVSRHHAVIAQSSGGYYVQDLDSANGTYVNEQRVSGYQLLQNGDALRLGNTLFDVQLPGAAEATQMMAADEYGAASGGSRRLSTAAIVGLLLAGMVVVVLAFVTILALISGGRNRPTVIIQSPAAGTQIVAGSEIILQATATGVRNISRLEVSVDGVLVALATSSDSSGQASLIASQPWTFGQPGFYTISAVAYTTRGRASDVASVSVSVSGGVAQVTPSATVDGVSPTPTPSPSTTALPTVAPPSATPEDTDEPDVLPSDTPTLTPTPTPTASATPTPTPSATSAPPPQIAFFLANPASISAGGCTTLQWGEVTNATEASINQGIGGVGTPGDRVVCPTETTTYVLTAVGPGGTSTASTTVTVSAALPDLTVESITFVPSPPVQNQDNEVRVTIRNIGTAAAGAFDWEWQPGTAPALGGYVGGGLNAGETMVVTTVWNPASWFASLPTVARVDVSNMVVESDDTNNSLQVNVQVIPPSEQTVTLTSQASLDGFRSNNNGGNATVDVRVGNGSFVGSPSYELVTRGFMSFDLSGIPAGATVQSIELRFYQVQVTGDPYGKLGNPTLVHVDYGGSLDASAYDTAALSPVAILSPHTSAGEWYVITSGTLGDWIEQDLMAGRSRFQLRLQFATETDGDGLEDVVSIESGNNSLGTGNVPRLVITYLP